MCPRSPDGVDILENHPKNENRIIELDRPETPDVEDYQFRPFRKGVAPDVSVTRPSDTRRDARFSMNAFARDAVTMREEERREFERRVDDRLRELVESEKKKAAEQGYQDGLEKGRAEAFAKFHQEASERLARFEKFVSECEAAKNAIFDANERFLMEMIHQICRMLFLKEVKVDQDYLIRLARELIDRVGVRENIVLRLHPDDMQTAEMLKQGLEATLGTLKNLTIEPSELVEGGGCALETQWNSIDASIQTQLQGIHDAIVGKSQDQAGG